MEPDNNSLELGDVENFKGAVDVGFNHSSLVMRAFQRVLEAASTELRTGWFNVKRDKVTGVETRTYIPDTRKVFIESVRTAEMMLSCDMDKEADDSIDKIKKALKKTEDDLIKQDDSAWASLPQTDKVEYVRAGYTHNIGVVDMPALKSKYISAELQARRDIFCELNKLAKRLDFFANEQVEG